MNRLLVAASLLLAALACQLTSLPEALAENPTGPCALFVREDAEQLFGHAVEDSTLRTTMFPAGESCRYTFTEQAESYGITVRIATSAAIREEGMNDSAADLMSRQKQARQGSKGHAAETFLELPGPGEEAFWNGTDLWSRNGDNLLIITVHAMLKDQFPDMASANAALAEQNLALSLQAAEIILARLQ